MPRLPTWSVLAALALAACEPGTAPEGPAVGLDQSVLGPQYAARPNPSFQPFAFSVDNCVETVDVSGTFHEVVQGFVGPNGKEHFRFHINAKGSGVGRLRAPATSGTTACSTSRTSLPEGRRRSS